MRINKIPNIYIPKQTKPFKIETLKEAPIKEIDKTIKKPIIKDNLGHKNFKERSLSETIKAHLNMIRNLEYTEVKWDTFYHDYDGKAYKYMYSKELEIGFYEEKFNNKLTSIDTYV